VRRDPEEHEALVVAPPAPLGQEDRPVARGADEAVKVPPTVLLHVYAEVPAPPNTEAVDALLARRAETDAFLRDSEHWLRDHGIEVRHRATNGEFDYYNAVLAVWYEPATLIVLEHDHVPTREGLLGLARCAYPACHLVSRFSTAAGAPLSAIVDTPTYEDVTDTFTLGSHSADEIPAFCDRVGFSPTKFSYEQRIRHPLRAGAVPWVLMDSAYCGDVKNAEPAFQWHVHRGPPESPTVRHNH
jgi:hypothetical protein